MNKLSVSTQQAAVLIAGMIFMFFFVQKGLGDVKAAGAALAAGALATWTLFQKAGDS